MPSSSIKIFDDCPPSKMVKVVDESPSMQLKASTVTPEVPAYWTKCDKCYGTNEHYHLITVDPSSQEWFNVCIPMLNVHFTIRQLQRIQNRSLWQRLQSERQLMKRDHPKHFDLNERLLYHTSRAEPRAICEEGLDQRLSRTGNFGQGIYFR